MKEAPGSSETSVLTRATGVTTQKTPFFKPEIAELWASSSAIRNPVIIVYHALG
jgi:hypothetical protein